MDCLVTKIRATAQNINLPTLSYTPIRVVYFGASLMRPGESDIVSGNRDTLEDKLVRISTVESDEKKVHWIAWKRGYAVNIVSWYNAEDNNILHQTQTYNVGDYEVHVLEKNSYIDNVSKIRLHV